MERKVTVNLIFVRHGFSCANKVKKFSRIPFRHSFYQDPELTSIGIERSIQNGRELRKVLKSDVHILASSSMIRSIETAYYMFNSGQAEKKPIYVLPYICEKGLMFDNMPLNMETQAQLLSSTNGISVCKRGESSTSEAFALPQSSTSDAFALPRFSTSTCLIDYRYVYDNFMGRHQSSYSKFVKWLGENLTSLMIRANRVGKSSLNMVIVTHSHFLNKDVAIKPAPLNNEAYHHSLEFIQERLISNPYGFIPVKYNINTHIPSTRDAFEPDRCRK